MLHFPSLLFFKDMPEGVNVFLYIDEDFMGAQWKNHFLKR